MTQTLTAAVRFLQQGEWERAHELAQEDESPLGCWAHGIVHVLEGDRENARYWYGRARRKFPEKYDVAAEIAALAASVKPG